MLRGMTSPDPQGPIKIALLHTEHAPAHGLPQRHPMPPGPQNERLPRGAAYVLRRLLGREVDLPGDPGAQQIAQASWDVRVAQRLLRRRAQRLTRIMASHLR